MKHPFYHDPNTLKLLRLCQTTAGFVPVVIKGRLHPVHEHQLPDYPVASDLSAEDYVLGLEALGCRFSRDAIDDATIVDPSAFRSPAWETRARQIRAVMSDHWEGRRTAVSDYLHAREGDRFNMALFSGLETSSALDPATLAVTLHQAFEEGQRAGLDLAQQAGRCPYNHEQANMRRSWMDGFAAGRVSRRALP